MWEDLKTNEGGLLVGNRPLWEIYVFTSIGFDSSSYCKGSLSNVQYSYPTQTKCNLAYLAQIYNLDCRLSNIEFCEA